MSVFFSFPIPPCFCEDASILQRYEWWINSVGQRCSLFHLIFVSYFHVCDNTTWSDFKTRHFLKAVRLSFHTSHLLLIGQSQSYYFETDQYKQEVSFAGVFKVLVIADTGVRKLIW